MTSLALLSQPDLVIENVPVGAITGNSLNPRVHPVRQINALARSIKSFGFVMPLLVDAKGKLVCGHARLSAAIKLGMATVPAVRIEHLSDHQLHALMLADNKLSDMSTWSSDLLAKSFQLLTLDGVNIDLESTGFVHAEIDLILNPVEKPPLEDPDDAIVAEPPGPETNRVGDVWQLGIDGRHRLACGSTLDPQVWTALMDGEKATMTISDVPYNVKIMGNVSGLGKIRHGEFKQASGEMDPDQYTAFLGKAFRNMADHSTAGSLHYAFIDWRHCGEMQAAGESVFSELKNVCVWDKGGGGGMGSLYRSAHEFAFVWKLGKARHRNNVELGRHGRNRSNIWRYPGIGTSRHTDEGDLLALHPTVKPVRMIADAMLDVTARGDIVVDGFLGSGSSTIAAERVGRRCFGIELDPRYADIAIRRFERHSGEEAVHVETGLTFAQLTAQRATQLEKEKAHD